LIFLLPYTHHFKQVKDYVSIQFSGNRIGGVMVRVLALSSVDRGSEYHRSNQRL
jgi:uncharacterized pyridoxamine 5'-phosphate oxidase family protein